MESSPCESTKFVLLIEEHKDVLIKSRAVEQTKKKEAAATEMIKKWSEVAGKTLTQVELYKKINNFKSRVKSALSSGKKLSEWQSKLLAIEEAIGSDEDEKIPDSNVSGNTQSTIPDHISTSASDEFLDLHETLDTKLLSNEQLQRLVLLKQVKVLTLQQQRLERLERLDEVDGKDIDFEYIGWDKANNN